MQFFQKAHFYSESLSDTMSPFFIRSLIKIRLMISRLYQRQGKFRESLKLLWKNINMLKLECSLRMNHKLNRRKIGGKRHNSEDLKMKKWSKYFILTLHQMISAYIKLEELEATYESARFIDWLTDSFYDQKSLFSVTIMNYTGDLIAGLKYELGRKTVFMKYIKEAIDKHFNYERYEEFIKIEDPPKTEFGFIPPVSSAEDEDDKKMAKNKKGRKKKKKKRRRKRRKVKNYTRQTSMSSARLTEPTNTRELIQDANISQNPHHKKNNSMSTHFTSLVQPSIYSHKSPRMDVYFNERQSNDKDLSCLSSLKTPNGSNILSSHRNSTLKKKSRIKSNSFRVKRSISSRTLSTFGGERSKKRKTRKLTLKDVVTNLQGDQESKKKLHLEI